MYRCSQTITEVRVRKLVVLICLMLFLIACRPDPLEQAEKQVNIGMPREEAVKILSGQAWYYQPCVNEYGITDLFFYGDHRYDEAYIVIMDSARKNGAYEVVGLGSFEPYIWHKVYADCIQRDRFED